MARDHTEEAIKTLVDLMRHAKSDAARGAAAQALMDRGYGKSVAVALWKAEKYQPPNRIRLMHTPTTYSRRHLTATFYPYRTQYISCPDSSSW
jgi:hypothetical protein